jgi:hypothetical protein
MPRAMHARRTAAPFADALRGINALLRLPCKVGRGTSAEGLTQGDPRVRWWHTSAHARVGSGAGSAAKPGPHHALLARLACLRPQA